MTGSWVSIVAMLGWLILALGAFASFKLSWRKGVSYALVWAAVFAGLAFAISATGG